MFFRSGNKIASLFINFIRLQPFAFLYYSSFTRKMLYRIFYFSVFCYTVGYFRRPYITRYFLNKEQKNKNIQAETVTEILSQLDIKLSNYDEKYFVVISGNCLPEKQQQLNQKQRIAFDLNNQIKKNLEINANYFGDIKFLFIGMKDIYDLLEANNTPIQFYEKERQKSQESMIYIFARESDGTQKMINAISYKADLKSIIRIISKHKARKFASQIQF